MLGKIVENGSEMTGKGRKLSKNDQKRFKCELCGKGFATKQRLKDHTNIHTGERPFMCKYCGASFANNGNCRMHERSMHLGHKR